MDTEKEVKKIKKEMRESRTPRPRGHYSNRIITARNGGVTPRNINSIGGCADNYK